jgi:hypothetical protein
MKTINNELIRSFKPCYDPSMIGIPDEETLSVIGWVEKYRNIVINKGDIIWLLCRNEFMSDKDLILFAVWCARSVYKYYTKENPIDPRTVAVVDCAERFAHGNATIEELTAARDAARTTKVAWTVYTAACAAACSVLGVAWDAAESAGGTGDAWSAESDYQIDQLLTYF